MKSLISVLIVAGVFFMFIGCAGTRLGYKDSVPDEIQNIIEKQYSKDIISVGTGTATDERIAIDVATIDARINIASQFSVKVRALKQVFDQEVNMEKVREYKGIMDELINMELKGAIRVKTMILKDNNIYKAKVLVVLSSEVLKKEIEEQLRNYTSEKSEEFKRELLERIEE